MKQKCNAHIVLLYHTKTWPYLNGHLPFGLAHTQYANLVHVRGIICNPIWRPQQSENSQAKDFIEL